MNAIYEHEIRGRHLAMWIPTYHSVVSGFESYLCAQFQISADVLGQQVKT